MATFTERIFGAARLNVRTYEDVEHDPTAFGQAMAVVVLSNVAAGIGWAGSELRVGLLTSTILALVGWFFWAWLTYIIGTRLLPEAQTRADWGQLLRTTGFAAAPGILRALGVVPFLRGLVFFVAGVWMLAAFVVAVRTALDYTSTLRAVGVCVIGWIVYGIFVVVLGGLLLPR